MPPKFKRHLNDEEVTGSIKSERRNLLEEDSDEEEDFFLRGPSAPKFGPKNDKIRQNLCATKELIEGLLPENGAHVNKPGTPRKLENQVDEVIDVMQENITRVIERGERLDELQDKSESLSDNATAFSSRARQLRRQMWWRECKGNSLQPKNPLRDYFQKTIATSTSLMKAIVALVFILILLVIIVPIILKYRS